MNELIDQLEDRAFAKGWDWHLEVVIAHECAWSAELRLTTEPNQRGKPDRSVTYFAAGGATGDDVAIEVLQAALAEFPA